jgi:hypothetical protein
MNNYLLKFKKLVIIGLIISINYQQTVILAFLIQIYSSLIVT